ncbi:peptidoglycan DD-metalloendopeptidase family protein [Deinococcus deserti]|uniref:Putative peptidase M23B n=1 Tax=Deinococcus deserti (strain DSM 17065 / CIP 109153 / LMG 22923 / VCD115) TaxID=546414 RepID=C1CV52_DEIDV|nr:peptidoglycan DD-metalloendopeptidase family protein [Deinococcus deserti]ACO46069.1 putative peptidase M23B, precursor [Deinococcus deserti VCD115]
MKFAFLSGLAARQALTFSLFACAAGAHAQGVAELPAPLAGLYPPADRLLHSVPDVTLRPSQDGTSVLVVTSGKAALKQIAARYGVTSGAVAYLPRDREPGRLVRVRLPEPAVERAPIRPPSIQTYRVRPGDSLASVASDFGLGVVDLLGANLHLSSLSRVRAGQTLNIPTGPRGLLVRIKPGQNAWSLIAGYGADLVQTVEANGVLPNTLRVGDELLLPDVRADGFQKTLLARQAAQRKAEAARRRQAQYQRFLAWKAERKRQQLQEKYERQERYEAYLAWKNGPERQRLKEAYERQVQYEAALARAQQKAAQQRTTQSRPTQPSVRTASSTDSRTLAWPMKNFRLTSRYAERDIPFHVQFFHGGIDLAAPVGTPIYAAADGTVTQSGYGAYGLNVYTVSGDSTLIYGHMSRTAVNPGQQVRQGELLGYIGCTGVCTGPHLHFEVRLGGQTVDPLALLP